MHSLSNRHLVIEKGALQVDSFLIRLGQSQGCAAIPHRHKKKSSSFADDGQKGVDPLGIEPRTFRALKANHSDVKRTLANIRYRYTRMLDATYSYH